MSISKKFVENKIINEFGIGATMLAAAPMLTVAGLGAGMLYSQRNQPKFDQIGEANCSKLENRKDKKKCMIYFLIKNRKNNPILNKAYEEQEKIDRQMKKVKDKSPEFKALDVQWTKYENIIRKHRDAYLDTMLKIKAL